MRHVEHADTDARHSLDIETRILILQIVLAMGNIVTVSLTQVAAWKNDKPKYLVPWLVVAGVQIIVMVLSDSAFLISLGWQIQFFLDLLSAGNLEWELFDVFLMKSYHVIQQDCSSISGLLSTATISS